MTVISNLTNLRPLRQYCEIFNYCCIVKFLFLDRYVVGPVPELPETPTHLSLLSDSVMRTPALNELSDEEKTGVCVCFFVCTSSILLLFNKLRIRSVFWDFGRKKCQKYYRYIQQKKTDLP